MKKILILLIGFAFTQSIQTKHVEVTIDGFGDYNLMELLDNFHSESIYSVRLAGYQLNNNITDNDMCDLSSQINIYPSHYNLGMSPMHYSFINFCYLQGDDSYGQIPIYNSGNDYINNIYPSMTITNDDVIPTGSITLTFWITGMFSENSDSSTDIDNLQAQIDDLTTQVNDLINQLTGCIDCQGDVNSNGYVNVSDIIMLIEHIIDIDSGNCFTP